MSKLLMKSHDVSRDPGTSRRLQLGPLRDNLGYLSRAMRTVAQQSAGDYVDELGFAAGQLTLVGLIAVNEGVTQAELARVMLIRKSQVTKLIQDLVARDLVSREEHGADRRYNTLALTEAGALIWRRAQDRIAAHSEMLLSVLDAPEREQLLQLLRKMLAAHLQHVDVDFD